MTKQSIYTQDSPVQKHTAIEKALLLLKLFSPPGKELGTMELSKITGFHKATVSRTLVLLCEHGFLEQNITSRKYRLGRYFLNLGYSMNNLAKEDLLVAARPHMDELRNYFNESVVLEVLSTRYVTIGHISRSSKSVRLAGDIGDALPVNITAGAKSIMAHLTTSTRDNFIQQRLERLTPNTITDQVELFLEYQKTKKRGYALDIGEYSIDVDAIGAPIMDYRGKPVAAVVMAGSKYNIDTTEHSDMIAAVKETATTISKQLTV